MIVLATLASALAVCMPSSTHALVLDGGISALYQKCGPALTQDLPGLTFAEQSAVFGMLVSYRFDPYGHEPTMPLGQTASEQIANGPGIYVRSLILASPTLACDDYAILAFWTAQQIDPYVTGQMVGLDHGPFGNHAQLFVGRLLLDPSAGIVAEADLPDLLTGHPGTLLANWRQYHDLDAWDDTVIHTITQTTYTGTSVIYDWPVGNAGMPGRSEGWKLRAAATD